MPADLADTDTLALLESIAEALPAEVIAATPPVVLQRLATLGHATAGLVRDAGTAEAHDLAREIDAWADKHLPA